MPVIRDRRVLRALRLALAGLLLGAAACRRGEKPATLVMSVPYEVETLDPHARDRLSDFAIAAHVYEPLVQTDADMGIRPCLATRWVNPDALTWVFTLRDHVTFHDGRPFSAEDAAYSLQRVMTDTTLDIGLYALQLESVRVADRLTLEVKTRRPLSVLLNKIASVLLVPKGTTKAQLTTKPIGTGPYRFERWVKGERVELTRNATYWGRAPFAETVTLLLARTAQQAQGDLLAGRSQFAQVTTRSGEEALKSSPDLTILHRTGVFLKYLGFDLARERTPYVTSKGKPAPNPFRRREVREAMSLAIDRRRLVSRLSTFGVPASQIVPPFIFGYNSSLPELRYDPARAKELLAGAGAQGLTVTLHCRRLVGEAAAIVAEMLTAVGFAVTVVPMAEEEFFAFAAGERPSLFVTRYGCSTGDASDVFDAGLHTVDLVRRFGTSNVSNYSEPSLDREIEASAEILEGPSRALRLHEIMRRASEDVLWVPLYFDEDVYAIRKPYTYTPRADSYVLAWEIGRS